MHGVEPRREKRQQDGQRDCSDQAVEARLDIRPDHALAFCQDEDQRKTEYIEHRPSRDQVKPLDASDALPLRRGRIPVHDGPHDPQEGKDDEEDVHADSDDILILLQQRFDRTKDAVRIAAQHELVDLQEGNRDGSSQRDEGADQHRPDEPPIPLE